MTFLAQLVLTFVGRDQEVQSIILFIYSLIILPAPLSKGSESSELYKYSFKLALVNKKDD